MSSPSSSDRFVWQRIICLMHADGICKSHRMLICMQSAQSSTSEPHLHAIRPVVGANIIFDAKLFFFPQVWETWFSFVFFCLSMFTFWLCHTHLKPPPIFFQWFSAERSFIKLVCFLAAGASWCACRGLRQTHHSFFLDFVILFVKISWSGATWKEKKWGVT